MFFIGVLEIPVHKGGGNEPGKRTAQVGETAVDLGRSDQSG